MRGQLEGGLWLQKQKGVAMSAMIAWWSKHALMARDKMSHLVAVTAWVLLQLNAKVMVLPYGLGLSRLLVSYSIKKVTFFSSISFHRYSM